jgi:hypothetical protein
MKKLLKLRQLKLFIIAFLMVLAGAVLPFLILMGILKSTFFLNFLAYMISVGGLFLGIIAVAMYVGDMRGREEYRDF